MPERKRSDAAERLLTAATQLFSEKGYERTSVGEIQEAAGLTFGSGALYKHFPSKQALLAEGVERFIESARSEHRILRSLDEEPVLEAFTMIAKNAMSSFARDHNELRIVWRDLEGFPELQEKVRVERIRATFDEFSFWIEHQTHSGRLLPSDSQAVAAVALSSLAFFQILKWLMHDTPGGVDEARFVDAWASLFAAALGEDNPEDVGDTHDGTEV